ncbi:CHAT domain-containing protein, partial [Eudoraea sp.]|uniref:CHAT domain-containing protein n=1 Tax=Eudoraea sp. TaxID=1979955 RepID=UPI003C71B2CC
KSKALRQAKLDYMNSEVVEELKHPFYWAGFIVVGDNAPLVASRNPIWIYIGIVLVLAIVYFLRRKLFKRLQ